MSLLALAGTNSATGGYEIANSCKFEDDNDEWLYRTNATGTNRRTWTVSWWFKQTELRSVNGAAAEHWQGGGYGEATRAGIFADDRIWIDIGGGDGNTGSRFRSLSTQKIRDTSAWYHIVIACDSTQSTEADRLKVWLNGVEVTAWDQKQYPTLNFGSALAGFGGIQMKWGSADATYHGYSGYLAECNYLDGVTATQNDFGEFDDDSGIWKPKAYTGSYGTNGTYLDFADASDLGDDESGNGNDYTENNITAADQATDTPTNNGCTLNVLASLEGSNDITEGALVSTGKAGGGGNFNGTYGTMGIDPFNSSVDWYWEIETSIGTSGSDTDIGIGWIKESRITSGSTAYNNVYADGISRYSSQTANAAGDIWGVLLETGTTPVFKLYRNDSLIHTSTHGSGGVSFDTLMFPYITVKGTSVDARLNFLNPASSFSIASGNADPNGYGNFEFDTKGGYALCTKNLAEYG